MEVFSLSFVEKMLYKFLNALRLPMCHLSPVWFYHINKIWRKAEYRLLSLLSNIFVQTYPRLHTEWYFHCFLKFTILILQIYRDRLLFAFKVVIPISKTPVKVKVQVKHSTYRPAGFQEFEAHTFLDNRHMKVVRLSALRTGRLNPKVILMVLISARGGSNPGP